MKTIDCPIQNGRDIAIVHNNRSLSYSELNTLIQSQVKRLGKDLYPGTIVAYKADLTVLSIVIYFALLRLKCIALPLNPKFPDNFIQEYLKKAGCDHFITPAENSIETDLPVFAGTYPLSQLADAILTSGSSGSPKAAVHTIGNHYWSAKGSAAQIPLEPGDKWLLTLPLFHISGISILYRAFFSGATVVIGDSSGITHVSLVETQLKAFPFGKFKLKAILLGGGPISKNALDNNHPIFVTYGMTEASSQIWTGSKPVGDIDIKFSEDQEILIKGKTLFAGYLEEGCVTLNLDSEGYFHTNDRGYMDDKGQLIITGRLDNMFISGGENIQPEEIERCLLGYKGIKKALVVPISNKVYGVRPFVTYQTAQNKPLDEEAIKLFLRTKLPGFKIPDSFKFQVAEDS